MYQNRESADMIRQRIYDILYSQTAFPLNTHIGNSYELINGSEFDLLPNIVIGNRPIASKGSLARQIMESSPASDYHYGNQRAYDVSGGSLVSNEAVQNFLKKLDRVMKNSGNKSLSGGLILGGKNIGYDLASTILANPWKNEDIAMLEHFGKKAELKGSGVFDVIKAILKYAIPVMKTIGKAGDIFEEHKKQMDIKKEKSRDKKDKEKVKEDKIRAEYEKKIKALEDKMKKAPEKTVPKSKPVASTPAVEVVVSPPVDAVGSGKKAKRKYVKRPGGRPDRVNPWIEFLKAARKEERQNNMLARSTQDISKLYQQSKKASA